MTSHAQVPHKYQDSQSPEYLTCPNCGRTVFRNNRKQVASFVHPNIKVTLGLVKAGHTKDEAGQFPYDGGWNDLVESTGRQMLNDFNHDLKG